ncbi:hypothetical protein C8R43DRAFT_961276 [Mycena crocata]|nr:hypothetical protein C8R43DRAFT_961276 [Mycena crocata]
MGSDTKPRQTPGLWFSDDGIVVLRAEDRLFRVQKAILAARSPVFQGCFRFLSQIPVAEKRWMGSQSCICMIPPPTLSRFFAQFSILGVPWGNAVILGANVQAQVSTAENRDNEVTAFIIPGDLD